MKASCCDLSRRDRLKRLLFVAIACAPLAVSTLHNAGVQLPLWGCPLLNLIGIPCPAWGLTRSFMAIAKGDWSAAITYHLFGPALFASFLLAGVHNLLELIRGQRIRAFYLSLVCSPRNQIFIFLMLLGYHGSRLYALAKTGELNAAFVHSPLARFW